MTTVNVYQQRPATGAKAESPLFHAGFDKLVGKVERDGYTIVPTAMYWSKNKIKLEVALAKGKQTHDKRDAEKDRDWAREKQRTMRRHNRDA